MSGNSRYALSVKAIGVLAVCVTACAQPSTQPGLGFPLIGVASGQTVRLNALNAGSRSSSGGSSCTVTLRIMDSEGSLLKEGTVSVKPGKGTFLDLARTEPGRLQIRGIALFGLVAGAAPGPEVRDQFDCNIMLSLEIFNSVTERTSVILTDAKALPLVDQRSVASNVRPVRIPE